MKVLYDLPSSQVSFTFTGCVEDRDLFSYIDEFIRECSVSHSWSESTIRSSHVLRNHLRRYGKVTQLEDFDEEGLDRYVRYLRQVAMMQESSCRKQLKNLQWFLTWAIRKGYTRQTAILSYKPKFKIIEKPVIFLTPEELATLFHFQLPGDGSVPEAADLERARDLFCFCAFTSLRYSDMAALRRGDIRDGILHVVTRKTLDSIRIELCPQARSILDKYADGSYPGDRALPVLSNQRMNDLLKELGRLCGLDTPVAIACFRNGRRVEKIVPKWSVLSTHAGRRTFICFALASGIPPQVVMKWTGHSDYKSMKPYIDIAEKTKSDAMRHLGEEWQLSLGG